MSSDATMEGELASVLADPMFVRSPVLARLLAYLVKTTASGDGRNLKSYAVAVEGLGRSPDLDPQIDTYARVQVARLRKALDAFYSAAGAQRSQRLTIDSGSYGVKLVPNGGISEPKPAGFLAGFTLAGRRLRAVWIACGLLALVALATAAVLYRQAESRAALARWKTSNFPSVTVIVQDNTGSQAAGGPADLIRQDMLMRIGRYQGIRVYYDGSKDAGYAVDIKLYPSGGGLLANTFVVDRRNNRLVWSTSDIIEVDPASGSVRDGAYVSQTAFTIAQGTGIIHSNERRSNYPVDTPYGCWLRFTTQMLNNHVVDDPILAECAEDWHEAVPDRPVPAGLYAWTLLDKSILKLGDGNRQALVQEALETLENARALNPTSGFLPAVATRAYALADEEAAMRAAADQALALNPGNLEIEGLAGSILAMRNDPRGERLVDDAIAHHPSPPPWYFVAKFVSAMMREDTAGAGRALARLQQLNHTLPVLPIFSAAYEARTGQLQKARASWERAETVQPILRVDPDLFLERTPLSPVVAARLKKWLGPVLD